MLGAEGSFAGVALAHVRRHSSLKSVVSSSNTFPLCGWLVLIPHLVRVQQQTLKSWKWKWLVVIITKLKIISCSGIVTKCRNKLSAAGEQWQPCRESTFPWPKALSCAVFPVISSAQSGAALAPLDSPMVWKCCFSSCPGSSSAKCSLGAVFPVLWAIAGCFVQ